jgi:hypothetical protein
MSYTLVVTAASLLLAAPVFAASPEELTWNELSTLSGRTVRIVMPSSAVLSGKLTAPSPEGLVIQVEKTTDKKAYPKGRFVVPRGDLKTFQVVSKRKMFRTIGAICGAWGGLGLGVYAAIHTNSVGAGLATMAGVGGGATVLGYYLGNAADTKTTTIVIRE